MTRGLGGTLLGLALAGCASGGGAPVPKMAVDFDFAAKHKCQGVSPRIQLGNVPAGATTYDVSMTDLDVPSFRHWTQRLPARGAIIPEGAGSGYYGPCPPAGATHRYQIEVTARDGQGQAIGRGDTIVVSGR